MSRRALHYVLKVGNLSKNLEFFRDKLGMKVLRHEVFEKGCEATCNGPYDGKWSKTMIGYGPEDDHFVLELTYNYSTGSYKLGNDLLYIRIGLEEKQYDLAGAQLIKKGKNDETTISLESPDGYKFILAKSKEDQKQDIEEVCLASSSLDKSKRYWSGLLKMPIVEEKDSDYLLLSYSNNQAHLRLKLIDTQLDHKSAYGRIAFSCASDELKAIQKAVEEAKERVLTPYLSLDTPGKATVQVVILADPDGHEICFVGDEGFRELSQVDPDANELIEKSIADDKSDEWFRKKKINKQEA